ncbi:ABC transporter permease [Trinickia caryophylli]|uniref:Monosaccharide ABC transporter membrane protein, CUT2 family n=1 Tax=Trinickia caryophylli TaxID=28094 RepID=A0A1X7D1C8_TRICW|nr:ABC transporter permease [Trinickia caryophylli]PMS13575.1 ABC transporter permease [Trinickia caryophylli]TRX15257.1 ABC transporter permease [Trinickia caryophylli]WQE15132.1 ABC transporter permease [Trinickia caryophylli]SMF06862.1 monosaccharide ABC transporter membrane protein, CUT2 family [Trinickia caryophylli]GLU31131.1 sugar ABC transporter permease [Trinickia caryophylli]
MTLLTRIVRAASRHALVWPALTLALLVGLDVAHRADFLAITMLDGHLFGAPIDILNRAAPLVIVSLGMTLVIATRGVDISVGTVVAIAGATAATLLADDPANTGRAVAAALAVGLVAGAWNGLLVAFIGMQPIIATLILMVAGRGVAQLLTDGQIIPISAPKYLALGGGYLATVPCSVWIALAAVIVTALLVDRTALGLFIRAIGINPVATRLVGLRSSAIVFGVYVCCGLAAALAGVITSSNVRSADGNNAGLLLELDAILAVTLGGTSLAGGRFSLAGTVLGALIIQTLTYTTYSIGVPPEATLVVKAIVVLVVSIVQSATARDVLTRAIARALAGMRAPSVNEAAK